MRWRRGGCINIQTVPQRNCWGTVCVIFNRSPLPPHNVGFCLWDYLVLSWQVCRLLSGGLDNYSSSFPYPSISKNQGFQSTALVLYRNPKSVASLLLSCRVFLSGFLVGFSCRVFLMGSGRPADLHPLLFRDIRNGRLSIRLKHRGGIRGWRSHRACRR